MEQIQINHTRIFGDIDRIMTCFMDMHMPVKMRLATAAGTRIRLATDVIEVSFTAIESNRPGAVAGVTFYYPPRAPGESLQMRFYLNAAKEGQCMEYRIGPRDHRVAAVLAAWWFLNSTYAPVVYTDPADLFEQTNWPIDITADEGSRIRQVVQLLVAYMAGERLKEKEVA
jgi:hypothetical protein